MAAIAATKVHKEAQMVRIFVNFKNKIIFNCSFIWLHIIL